MRNSADYLGHAQRAARLARVSSSTLCVVPQFLTEADIESAPYWDVDGWKSGQLSLGSAAINAFVALDCLLRQLAGQTWPGSRDSAGHCDIKRVVIIAGNSADGQFVNRYAAVGREPEALALNSIQVHLL